MVVLSPFILLLLYLAAWGLIYRIPHPPPQLVDLRSVKQARPYYVAFCAALADNPHGFPGHAYVAFFDRLPAELESSPAFGFIPSRFFDQVTALFKPVKGVIGQQAAVGNTRNFDALVVVVDYDSYRRLQNMSRSFDASNFKVGSKDCVTFANAIASSQPGLIVPDTSHVYPQDYVSKLKRLNQSV